MTTRILFALLVLSACLLLAIACRSSTESFSATLHIGGIPDQETSVVVRRFGDLAHYLEEELGVPVEYVPSIDYAAVVTAFKGNDIQLAWFGGLTGVQARNSVAGSEAIAQRPRDEKFRSVFVVQADIDADTLVGLRGLTFTFGSESSTSGHLMPRFFLKQAEIDADTEFKGLPNFSGSHDKTWKLVESQAFQAGVLSEAVWLNAVSRGRVDLKKVRILTTTEPYYDYNWSVRPDLDGTFGDGFTEKIKAALLSMGQNERQRDILADFGTESFIGTQNENYERIHDVAKELGMAK